MAWVTIANVKGPRGPKGDPGLGAEGALQFKLTTPPGDIATWIGTDNAGIYRLPTQTIVNGVVGRPPGAGPANVSVLPVGSTASIAKWDEIGEHGRIWECTISSNASLATGWVQRARATRFGTALTCAQGGGVTTASNVGHALPYTPGARVDRWRLHLRNYNERSGTAYTGALAIFGISVGEMQRTAAGKPWGAWAASGKRTNIVPGNVGATTPESGNEYITPWVDDFPLEAMQDYVFRYAFTGGTQNKHLAQGGGWSLTGGSAPVNSDAPAMTQVKESPLDVWIEGYSEAGVKIFAGFGDSLTVGHSADLPVYDSWVSKVARAEGAHPMFYAHSGTAYTEWDSPSPWKLHKYNNDAFYKMTLPTKLFNFLGSNDIFGTNATLAEMIARFKVTLPLIKAKTTQNVVFMTVLPRHDATAPQEVVRKQWNNWLMDNAASYGLFVVDVASAVDDGSGSKLDLRWAASTTDIHLKTAGYARIAAMLTGALTTTGLPFMLDTDGVPYF